MPRANFECRKCQATYEDLPVASVRCPVCGFKRGFRRLFDAVNVSTNGHKVAKILDPMLAPQIDQFGQVKAETAASAGRLSTERDQMYEKASPDQRAQLAQMTAGGTPSRWTGGAKGTFDSIPADARAHSAWPFVKRRVVPVRAY